MSNRPFFILKEMIKRDLVSALRGPMVLGILIVFPLIFGVIMSLMVSSIPVSDLYPMMFASYGFLLMICLPIIAARPGMGDRETGVDQIILSTPIPSWCWVVSRWVSGVLMSGFALASTVGGVVALVVLGNPDVGKIVTVYLGWLVFAAVFSAVGVWASILSKSAVMTVFLAWGALLLMWLLAPISILFPGQLGEWVRAWSLVQHTYGFEQGVLIVGDLVYFGVLTLVILWSGIVVLDHRRLK
jgi:ABC-2 type transport system permease protein